MLKSFLPASSPPRLISVSLLASLVIGAWLLIPTGQGQLAAPKTVTIESLAPLLMELKKQQDDLTTNQTKIEAQTAALKEQLRIAKIYSARSR